MFDDKQLQPGPDSQPPKDLTSAAAIKDFMLRVVAWPLDDESGNINLEYQAKHPQRDKPIWISKSATQIDEFLALAKQKANEKTVTNIYFCLSRQAIADKRKAEDAQAFRSIWTDIDVKAKGYATIEEAIDALFEFIDYYRLPPPSAVVISGSGLHVYWFSTRPLSYAEWRPYAEGLKAAAVQWGLKCDAGVIADAARVLRVPGTRNCKTNPPKRVRLILLRDENIDFAADLKALSDLAPRTNGIPEGIVIADAFKHLQPQHMAVGIGSNDAPLPLQPILDGCGWLAEAYNTGGKDYDQTQWNLTTLAATFLENGHELAHKFGNQHPKYSVDTTDEIWERKNRERRTKNLGWPQCKTISDNGGKPHCSKCPHFGAGKSPLHLALAPQGAAELPNLVIGHEPTAVAKELAKLIAQGNYYFFNGNALVRIAIEVNDMPRAIEVSAENVRVLAHEISNPIKRTNQGTKPAEIRADVANIYLKGLEGRWGLKHFAGIATTPILSGDGSIRSMDGYDPATGLWCHNVPALSIPETPSGQEAAAALLRIRHTFRTFPFTDAARTQDLELGVEVVDPSKPTGLDESSFLVALLTAACRPSLPTAPGFLCDAPKFSGAGTGKGLLAKAICIIASGASPHAFTSGHDAAELDKRLSAALVQGRPAVFLDNFNAKELVSDTLASALTENPAQVRILGVSKMVPLHVSTFIVITGTGVAIAEDMARRILNTHIDAKIENPEERKFRPGFLDDIRTQRPFLLSDLLTIWRWGRQNPGVLEVGRPLGSYEIWAQWVRDPLLTLGLRDPVERIAEIKANDPKRRALIELFDLWHEKHKDTPVRAAQLDPEVIQLIDVKARKKDDGTIQYNRQWVARFLTQSAGTRVGGYLLGREVEGPSSKPFSTYKLVRTTT